MLDQLAYGGLKFFGTISASISHEIKNCLATIHEQNGLLEDFLSMTDSGRPLDTERIKVLAGKVEDQVQRANGIVKRMNEFSHTVDEPVTTVELNKTLELFVSLVKRIARVRGYSVEAEGSDSPAIIKGNAFLLLNLLYRLFEPCFEEKNGGGAIGLQLAPDPGGMEIVCTGDLGPCAASFRTDEVQSLLKANRADVRIESDQRMCIVLGN